MGFCRDSYCAYSGTEVRVNSFELHIDCQLSKRGVIYLFNSRKRHISSKGKSDTWVISSLLFDFVYTDTNICEHDSTYTLFTAFISNTDFFVLPFTHKFKIQI